LTINSIGASFPINLSWCGDGVQHLSHQRKIPAVIAPRIAAGLRLRLKTGDDPSFVFITQGPQHLFSIFSRSAIHIPLRLGKGPPGLTPRISLPTFSCVRRVNKKADAQQIPNVCERPARVKAVFQPSSPTRPPSVISWTWSFANLIKMKNAESNSPPPSANCPPRTKFPVRAPASRQGNKFWKKRPRRQPKSMDDYLVAMQRNRPREVSIALRLRDVVIDPVRAARVKLGLPALAALARNSQASLEVIQ